MKRSVSSARVKQPARSAKPTKRSKGADEPSAESLREIPPMKPGTYTVFKGPGALERALSTARAMRMGRPKKGAKAVGTATKSLRLSKDEWAELERVAEKRRTTLHAIMRDAVLSVLRKSA
jgi:hypothetical protein